MIRKKAKRWKKLQKSSKRSKKNGKEKWKSQSQAEK
jgi:hypothetical protein